MKSLGIVRKVDELGRIVIPKELRRSLMISKGQPIEIFTSDNMIVLRKFKASKTNEKKREVVENLKNIHTFSNRRAGEIVEDAIMLLEREDVDD